MKIQMRSRIKCYTELSQIREFTGRYNYLRLNASVGVATFGSDRYLNQQFYTSALWKSTRNIVIVRDNGCDLGIDGYEIYDRLYIHHMNPITPDEILAGDDSLLDPEFLISVSQNTHNAIHYGDESLLVRLPVARRPGDTKLW